MKKILLSITGIIASILLYAQVPNFFNYQAIARNSSGALITNQVVSFKISMLHGSVSGTSVYSETHLDSTNAYGLVTLEIGNGTTVDDFSTINWANGTYFVKIEMDATGGTSYQLMGTSQLLSVPYAITASNIVAKNELGRYYRLKFNKLGVAVGEYISPDTIIKIDFNGPLYVHPEDNNKEIEGIKWYNGIDTLTNATSTTDGAANTDSIVKYQGAGAYAAYLCDTLTAFSYSDWYLPAKDELNALYGNFALIGGFRAAYYWSSTELSKGKVSCQGFTTGAMIGLTTNNMFQVRCVRRD